MKLCKPRSYLFFLLVFIFVNSVHAEDFPKLDEAVSEHVKSIAPVFDFENNGCYPSAGISRNGMKNYGLKTSGPLTGNCRADNFLQTSNTLHRSACATKNGDEYCGHFFALYFEKDQAAPYLPYGHRHDWEHIAIWTQNGEITHGSVSAHGEMTTQVKDNIEWEDNHLKVVYIKDGIQTHAMRFARPNEPAENREGKFVTPTIISWYKLYGDNINNSAMRNFLNTFNYGSAGIPLKDQNFFSNLNKFKPAGYPLFNKSDYPTQLGNLEDSNCKTLDKLSEEEGWRVCDDGYVMKGFYCESGGDYCDNKRLLCCKDPSIELEGENIYHNGSFSEEAGYAILEDDAIVGLGCSGRYCDNVHFITRKVKNRENFSIESWTHSFSDESNGEYCPAGAYVDGMSCSGRYCDNLRIRCKYRIPKYSIGKTIKNKNGKCLDIVKGNDNSPNVQVFDCHGEANQNWIFKDGHIKAENGKCLDIEGGINGRNVQVHPCHGGANQNWIFEDGYIKAENGKCLDIEGGINGTNVQVHSCHGGANQSWAIRDIEIVSLNDMCLDAHRSDYNAHLNGGRVQMYACNVPSSVNQAWTFEINGTIRSSNGQCLDVHRPDYDSKKNGGRVQFYDCNGWINQQWFFENGLIKSSNGLCLDIHRPDYDNNKNGGKVQLWQCNGYVNQNWNLIKN